MKRLCTFLPLGLLAAIVALAALPRPSAAQGLLTITPDTITIAAVAGEQQARTLLITAAAPLSGLRITMLDLVRADNRAAFSAAQLGLGPVPQALEAGAQLAVPVSIDTGGLPSGAYSGSLLLAYDGGTVTVPVAVTIKDPWPAPLLIMVLGVAASTAISVYRAQGRSRDELAVRIGRLRTQASTDREIPGGFATALTTHLATADLALQAGRVDEAGAAMAQADAVWASWLRARPDWLREYALGQEIERTINQAGLDDRTPYIAALRKRMQTEMVAAPGHASPQPLHDALDQVVRQLNPFLRLTTALEDLDRQVGQSSVRLSPESESVWRQRVAGYRARLSAVLPEDEAGLSALQAEVSQAIEELRNLPPEEGGVLGAVSFGMGSAEAFITTPPASVGRTPAPAAWMPPPPERLAALRLWTYRAARYLIAIIFLAGAGFMELYLGKADFGADAWRDYFTILIWGFSAEASRTAITDLARGGPGVGPRDPAEPS